MTKHFKNPALFLQVVLGTAVTLLTVAGLAGATSIGTNISTDGSLTVIGTTTVDGGTFYVDALNNRVGVGTTTPQFRLDVDGDVNVSSSSSYKQGGISILRGDYLDNLFVGLNAGRSGATMTSGSNTFIGGSAGYNCSGGSCGGNTFLGAGTGYDFTGGQNNSFIGYNAGGNNVDGNNNILIGTASGWNNVSGGDNVFLGYNSGYFETGSNKLYITNSDTVATTSLIYGEFDNNILAFNANVGIGTTTPDQALTIDQGNLAFAGTMYPEIYLYGSANVLRLDHFESTTDDLRLELFANTNGSGDRDLDVYGNSNLYSRISGTRDSFIMGGDFGIGTSTPEANLHLTGGQTSTSTIEIGETNGTKGSCLKLRDSDGAGWTYCTTLDGTMTCGTTSCE